MQLSHLHLLGFFIETLLITEKIENINLHNKRMNKTRYDFFKLPPIDLRDFVKIIKNINTLFMLQYTPIFFVIIAQYSDQ